MFRSAFAVPFRWLVVFRICLFLSLLTVAGVFAVILKEQARTFGAELVRRSRVEEGAAIELSRWQVSLLDCQPGSLCVRDGEPRMVDFPSKEPYFNEFSERIKGSAVARIEYELGAKERAWLAGREFVSLVIPRNVQISTRIADTEGVRSAGVGTNSEFGFWAPELLKKGVIALEVDYSGLPFFGPMDVPIVLCEPGVAQEYQSLAIRQQAAAHLQLQLGIGFRLIIAAMALVLDHSLQFGLLAFYGVSRALRALVPFWVESGVPLNRWLEWAFALAGGLSFAALLLFILESCGRGFRSWRKAIAWTGASVVVFGTIPWLDSMSWIRVDLYSDGASAAVGLAVVFWSLWGDLRSARRRPDVLPASWYSPSELFHLGIVRKVLIGSSLGLSLWANATDLIATFSDVGFKVVSDWRHAVLFPALTIAALLEVGFTSRKVQSVAEEMTEKAILDHDLATARTHQRSLLPPLRSQVGNVAWRACYRPAAEVAGDWFDVREISFLDGERFLAAALVDVTGHGVSAALSTTVFAAFWSQWCSDAALQLSPHTHEEKERVLCDAVARIHRGLTASRQAGSGTAVFLLFDIERNEVTACCAGHQSPVVVGKEVRTVASAGPGLGFPGSGANEETPWNATSFALAPGEKVIAYSDGVFSNLDESRRWVRDLKRRMAKGPVNAQLILLQKMRASLAAYRADRSIEDDMTLVVFEVRDRC